MQTAEFFYPTWSSGTILARSQCAALLLTAILLLFLPSAAATPNSGSPETNSQNTVPWSEIGAAAGAQYSGDGLMVKQTRDGARLRCLFQRMEGEATCEGLWLNSTVTNLPNERFRVTAMAVSRAGGPQPADGTHGVTGSTRLPATGNVTVDGNIVRFTRPGLVEEYSVSMDGVRQDFLVLDQPHLNSQPSSPKQPELRIELAVTGARVAPSAHGAQLTMEHSGRKIAYSRLKVTDAKGRELPARMETICKSEIENRKSEINLAILVDDADAVYPVRIDPTFSDANWISMGGFPGTDSSVSAAVVDASGNLYIGGAFNMVGDVVANNIAKWGGSSWSALGSGMNGDVYALAVSGSDLYAGGEFTTAGSTAATYIAKWNGSSWNALDSGMNERVFALAVAGSNLYAGGEFTTAGGVAANYVAKWSGSSWSALGSGVASEYYTCVSALAVSGSDLYAGFALRGGGPAGVAKWDGSNWSQLGSGMNDVFVVSALAVSGSNLYVGGAFTMVGGVAAANIAKWDGNSWSTLGSGMTGGHYYGDGVYALAVSGSDLYAGGNFTIAGGVPAKHVAKWDGSGWSAVGSGMADDFQGFPSVTALAVSDGNVYAAGWFTTAGGVAANNIAKWNGSSWSALGSGMGAAGMNRDVSALAVSGSDLYAGGMFTAAGGNPVNYIAKWDGASWSALGSGVDFWVNALTVADSNLYVGGDFRAAGGVAASRIAKWNGSRWSALGSGIGSASPGDSPRIYALAVSGNDLYAAGVFTMAGDIPATNIAKWNGTSWSALGSGITILHGFGVYALAVSGNDLFAGGRFTAAGGVPANNIAKWDGTNWSALGLGVEGPDFPGVFQLAVSSGELYAGGRFSTAGSTPANNIAKWNGGSWSALGSGMNGGVSALAVSGGDLYAGGGESANSIAKWDGRGWSALGSGITIPPGYPYHSGRVFALAVSGSDLYAGGDFTMAGGKVSAYLAKAIINPPVLKLEHSSGTNFIRFSGVPGTAYHLQRAPSLAGPWPNIATNTAPANGRIEIGDGSPPFGRGFYRIVEP